VFQRRVVDQHRDRLSAALDHGGPAAVAWAGQLDGSAVGVDVAGFGREPVTQRQRRIAEGSRQRLGQAHGGARLAQLDHEPSDRATGQLALEKRKQHRDRDDSERIASDTAKDIPFCGAQHVGNDRSSERGERHHPC